MVVSCPTYMSTLATAPSFSGLPSGQPVTYVIRHSYFLTTFLRLITRKKLLEKTILQTTVLTSVLRSCSSSLGHKSKAESSAPHVQTHTQARVICRGLSEHPEVTCAPGGSCPEVSCLLGFAILLQGQHLLNSSPEAAVSLPPSPHLIRQGLYSEDRLVTDAK